MKSMYRKYTCLKWTLNTFKVRIHVLMALLPVFFISCSVSDLEECFSNTGKTTTVTRELEYYDSLEVYNNVNVVLEPGDGSTLRVEGGENVLPFIKTFIIDNTLVIRNTMTCNWMRDYQKEITVYLPANNLKKIRYEGSGDITTSETLAFESFEVSAWGGSGDITLSVECYKLYLALHYGTVKFDISGRTAVTTIYANSYGPFYCTQLISDLVYILNSGINDCYVHAETNLEAEVTSVGNIYYCGNPTVNCVNKGTGIISRITNSDK